MIGNHTVAGQKHQTERRSLPLTRHPLFVPAITVWFGALFSLSTLAIKGEMLERWVIGTQLDLILPAATPPLGMKARLLVALFFGAMGALIGWLGARAISQQGESGHAGQPNHRAEDEIRLRGRDRHPDAPARRPIRAHAELGDEGLDYAAPVAAPPAQGAPVMAPTLAAATPAVVPPPFAAPVYQPAVQPPYPPAMGEPFAAPYPGIEAAGIAAPYAAPYPAPAAPAWHEAPAPLAPVVAAHSDDAQGDDAAWHALPPLMGTPEREAEPAPEPAGSMVPQMSASDLDTVTPPVEAQALAEVPAELPAMIGATPVQPQERIASAPLSELSHVELIERLALALHKRESEARTQATTQIETEAPAPTPSHAHPDAAVAPAPLRAAAHMAVVPPSPVISLIDRVPHDDRMAMHAHLRTALAGLREVK